MLMNGGSRTGETNESTASPAAITTAPRQQLRKEWTSDRPSTSSSCSCSCSLKKGSTNGHAACAFSPHLVSTLGSRAAERRAARIVLERLPHRVAQTDEYQRREVRRAADHVDRFGSLEKRSERKDDRRNWGGRTRRRRTC
jgi:hypothetical protein